MKLFNNMNNKTKTTKILILPVIVTLLTMTLSSVTPYAFGDECGSPHCYAIVYKDKDNRGGSATLYVNSGNSVESGYGIANPLWIVWDDGQWLEVGWEKGSFLPCNSTNTNGYHYQNVTNVKSGTCDGTPGTAINASISDGNKDNTWELKINGTTVSTAYIVSDANEIHVGGESTHEDNVLDNGRASNLQIIYPSGTTYTWGSNNLGYITHQSYTYSWNTSYTDFGYGGP